MYQAVNESKPKENHHTFLKRFELKVTPSQIKLIDFAYEMAKVGHGKQFRDSGERYFEHLRETAIILVDELGITDTEMIIATLLHDMLEDNFLLDPDRIKQVFGNRVEMLVTTVTKPKKNDVRFTSNEERHKWYFDNVAKSHVDAKIIKLADRLQNMRTLGACTPEKQARKIKETKEVYYPLIADVEVEYPEIARYLLSEIKLAINDIN